ncbi:hypothetical protein RI367_002680 [Sorochytrium milnesiophthora]
MSRKAVIYVVIYSTYHHVYKLAQSIKEGVDASGVAEATIFRVAETLPQEVLTKMHAPPPPDVPVITAQDLPKADGILFGAPTRFGTFPTQMRALLDSCGQLWQTGALAGKPAGLFFSTASQHGGQETTAFTAIPFFAHLGMPFIPLGYASPHLFNFKEVHGGGPWGAGTIAGGDGSRQPSEAELDVAKTQGKNFAAVAAKLLPAA